jgi:hypothetical protein
MADGKPAREELSAQEALRMMERRQRPPTVTAEHPAKAILTHGLAVAAGVLVGWMVGKSATEPAAAFTPLATPTPVAAQTAPVSAPPEPTPQDPPPAPRKPEPVAKPAPPWWHVLPVDQPWETPYRVYAHTDRFDGTTLHSTPRVGLPAYGLELAGFFVSRLGRSRVDADLAAHEPSAWNVILSLTDKNRDWQYLENHSVHFLADGAPVEVFSVQHKGDVGNGYVEEHVSFAMRAEEFAKLVSAQQVELRLGRHETTVQPAMVTCLRELAYKMRQEIERVAGG